MEGRVVQDGSDAEFGQIVYRLKKGKRDLQLSSVVEHTCCHATCNPQAEPHLVHNGTLEGPPISCNVYLCQYGVIHICSESSCDLYGYFENQTCPLSGLKWGISSANYDKNDHRTWKNGGTVFTKSVAQDNRKYVELESIVLGLEDDKRKVSESSALLESPALPQTDERVIKKKRARLIIPALPSKKAILEKARDVIDLLLFSKSRRNCNLDALYQFNQEAEKAKHTYIMKRMEHRQFPYLTDILRLKGYYLSQPLPLMEMERQQNVVEYYAHVILQVWDKVIFYAEKPLDDDGNEIAPRIDFETVAVGTLYLMREGLQCNEVFVLPADQFLMSMLPLVRDMEYFNIKKRKITRGSILIENTYRYAVETLDTMPEELVLDASVLPALDSKSVYTKLGKLK